MTAHETTLKNVQEQIMDVCKKLGIGEDVAAVLQNPARVIEVNIPVKMDNGKMKVFKGYRSQHNDAAGPTKGGIRFHQNVSKEEVIALSIWMSLKCAVTDLPYGGGKGGVIVNPKELSKAELERLSRGFVDQIYRLIGERVDIPAPDVNTNGQIMSWMLDEYIKVSGKNEVGTFTGKPIPLHGSEGRTEATGLGIVITMREACKRLGIDLKGAKVSVQGFGNVGSNTAKYCEEYGAKVVAMAEFNSIVYKEDGFDIAALREHFTQHGTLSGFPGAKDITDKEFWALPVDILVPAALENAITIENAPLIQAKIVVEGANGPVDKEADEYLYSKNVLVVPDILANAGGVTVSYFEWLQNISLNYWGKEEVLRREEETMVSSFDNVYKMMEEQSVSMRTASFMYAIRRIVTIMEYKGHC